MSSIAMSNKTGLDWLARNVHVWKWKSQDWCWVFIFEGAISAAESLSSQRPGDIMITRYQWLTRRAELQNKPSWKDAPEWAQWVAQHESGYWGWGSGVANVTKHTWGADAPRPQFIGKMQWSGYAGEVLGDWRDTLERRPEPTRAEMEVELVKAAFKPFTSIEDNQEQEVKQDNGWLERGELPPVGTVCEYTLGANAPWYQCEIKYVIRGDGVVMKRIPCGDEQYCGLHHKHPVSFRLIRTDRELAIDEMKQACPHHGSWDSVGRIYAEALYDAGYRKDPK